MAKKDNKPKNENRVLFLKNLYLSVLTNLASALLLAGALFFDEPYVKIAAYTGFLSVWIVLGVLIKTKIFSWKRIKHIGFYFILTAPIFRYFETRNDIQNLNTEIDRLKKIIVEFPEAKITDGMVNPQQQEEAFEQLLDEMQLMPDERLALLVSKIRNDVTDILASVGANGNYHLFTQVIIKLSLYEPKMHPQTHAQFLHLLLEIYEMPPREPFSRQFQTDVIEAVKNVIRHNSNIQFGLVEGIVNRIMTDPNDDHELSIRITEMLLTLDWKQKKQVCQMIFDESKRRAFLFRRRFGAHLLHVINQLQDKVFYTEQQSLHALVEDSVNHDGNGVIDLNKTVYDNLCSLGVFAPLENPDNAGHSTGRVFRRLDERGRVDVECTLDNGEVCKCRGKSLSFKGLYSKDCPRRTGERLKTKIIPILEFKTENANRKPEFEFTAQVADLHEPNQLKGRGLFFESGEDKMIRSLYDYILQDGSSN